MEGRTTDHETLMRPDRPATAEIDRGGFQLDIHAFRALAISFIVIMHSLELGDWTHRPLAYALINTFFGSMSILFFFISGYLFQHLSGRFRYPRYLKRKAAVVVLPYLIISIPAIIVAEWFIPEEGMWPWFDGLPRIEQILIFYLTGKHLEPLWFVPTVVLIYLMAPLLLKIDRIPRAYWVLLPLTVLSLVVGRDGPTGPLQKAVYMLPAYISGMAVSHYRERVLALSARYLWVLLLAIVGLYLLILLANPLPGTQLLLKLAMCLAILTLFRKVRHVPPLVNQIAHLSFGIYFLHGYLLAATRLLFMKSLGTPTPIEGSLPLILVAGTVTLLATLFLVHVAKRILGRRSRYIIGA